MDDDAIDEADDSGLRSGTVLAIVFIVLASLTIASLLLFHGD